MSLWSMGCLHVLTATTRTMGGMWCITVSPPSSRTGGMPMLVQDYQGPLISVFSSLIDRGTSSDMNAPPARQCAGPVRAALRWAAPPIAEQVAVYAGLFHDFLLSKRGPQRSRNAWTRSRARCCGEIAHPPRQCMWWMLWREPESRILRDALSTAGDRCATAVRASC